MLKLLWVLAALGAIAVVVWFFVVSLSPSYNDCISKNGQHPTENYTADGQQIVDGPIDNPTVTRLALHCGSIFANRNGEAFTGLFTIALTFATFFLGYMAWDQGIAAKAESRAYLSVVIGGAFYQERAKQIKFEADPIILNNGSTPAYNVRFQARARIITDKAAKNFRFSAPDRLPESQASIGPKENREIRAWVDRFIPDHLVLNVLSGTKAALFVWGVVHYDDTFGAHHYTQFCQRLYWQPGRGWMGNYDPRFGKST